MANFVKVKKMNPEFQMLRNMIQAEDENMNLEDVLKDKYVREMFTKQLGVDLTKVSLNPYYELWLDLDRILAIGEIENIPGMDNMKGFSVWFNNEAKNCWYLDPDSYDIVISNIPKSR